MSERTRKQKIKHVLKITGIVLGILLILLVTGYFFLNRYIQTHKDKLLADITERISENIDGKLIIEDMEPALLKSFPNISVQLLNLKLQDSLYYQHKKNTIELKYVYVKLNLLSFFTSHPQIKKVTLSEGSIYLFKNKDEYSNTYLFQKKSKKKKKKSGSKMDFHDFKVENVLFTFDNFLRNKQFKFKVNSIDGHIVPKNNKWFIYTKTDAFVYQLGFNLDKGGYLVNSPLEGNLKMVYNKEDGHLDFPKQLIQVSKIPVELIALFDTKAKPVVFKLDFNVKAINFTKGIHLLPQHISSKLNVIKMKDDLAAHAKLTGSFAFPDTPLVNINFAIENNEIAMPFGVVKNATLYPVFNNHIYPGKGRSDNNTAVSIPDFKGTWMGIPIAAEKIRLFNLTHPLLNAHIKSEFHIKKLSEVMGTSFDLQKGNAKMDITYSGPVSLLDEYAYKVDGYIKIDQADFAYLPKQINFKNSNFHFLFKGRDLFLKNIELNTKNSKINIDGDVANFLSSFLTDPTKAIFNWRVSSSSIDLNDFKNLIAPRKKINESKYSKNKRIERMSHKIDDLLEKSTMLLDLDVKKTNYRRFTANSIKGKIALKENRIDLSHISFNHAGGQLSADGSVYPDKHQNPFNLKATVKNVKADQLFYAFENFGQTSIVDTNLEGSFSATVDIQGKLGEQLGFVKNSVDGKVNFNLIDGELNELPTLITISKFIFKNRNLDHVTFKNLQNQLTLKNGKIFIPKMEIESSAVRIILEGVYAFDKGTDMSIIVPLRNPEKDKKRVEKGLEPKKTRGIVLYLRAQDDEDGKVHIGWDPLKKGMKERDGDPLFPEKDLNKMEDTFFVK